MKKTILLVGASGGIGRALIAHLADLNYNLALHYHGGFKELEETLELVQPKTKVAMFPADLKNEASVIELVECVKTEFGQIDILINNAGVSSASLIWKTEEAEWDNVLDINLKGCFFTMKHVIPIMRALEFGRIINISSVVGHLGIVGSAAYAASKAGLEGMSRAVASEVLAKNITVNSLAYGYMEKGMIDDLSEEIRNSTLNAIPMKKFGEVSNILNALKYLMDEKTNYVTGQVLHINGGLLM